MPTMTAPAAKVNGKSKAKSFSATLVLEIEATSYEVEPTDPGEEGTRAYRLVKRHPDGNVYDCVRTHDGLITCDCPDYEFNRRGITHEPCKHGRALVLVGLLDASAPVPGPHDERLRRAVENARPEPPKPVEPEGTHDAHDWIKAICGRLWDWTTPEQRAFAIELTNRNYLSGTKVTPPGPSLAELERMRAEALAPEQAGAPACCPADEAAPCKPCQAAGTSSSHHENVADRPFGAGVEPAAPESPVAGVTPSDPPAAGPEAEGGATGTPVPSATPDPDRLTLDAWVEAQADRYALLDHAAGELVAHALRSLAETIRFVRASHPADVLPRADALGVAV